MRRCGRRHGTWFTVRQLTGTETIGPARFAGLHSKDLRDARQETGTEEADKVRRPSNECFLIKGKKLRSFLQRQSRAAVPSCPGGSLPGSLRILKLLRPAGHSHQPDQRSAWDAAIDHRDQYPDSGGSDLIDTEIGRARKASKKLRGEVRRDSDPARWRRDQPEKGPHRSEMPLRTLYELQRVGHRAALFDRGIMGVLDVPDLFLDPCRVQAALIMVGALRRKQVPQQCKVLGVPVTRFEFALDYPPKFGTNAQLASDIQFWVNDVKSGLDVAGRLRDRRGVHTPRWWKLEGSQYGALAVAHLVEGHLYGCEKAFIGDAGSAAVSRTSLDSCADRIDDKRAHPAASYFRPGLFGNHNQNILMRLHLK